MLGTTDLTASSCSVPTFLLFCFLMIRRPPKYTHCISSAASDVYQSQANDSGNGFSRLGLAISKKEYKRAVDRNLFKRLARETFRKNQDNLDHLDFVVMAKKSKSKNNSELTLDLITLMKNAKTKAKTQ